MKRLVAAIFVVLIFAMPAFAQETVTVKDYTGARMVYVENVLVSGVDSVYSKWFGVNGFQNFDMIANPYSYGYLLSSSAGKPKITMILQGSYDQTSYANCDTLSTSDSTETFINNTGSIYNAKYPFYRLLLEGTAANAADSYIDLFLYFIKKD